MPILNLNDFFSKEFHDQQGTIAEPSLIRVGRPGIVHRLTAMESQYGWRQCTTSKPIFLEP